MCEFISWVETKAKEGNTKYHYLTHDLVYNTPKGEEIQRRFTGSGYIGGHAAIRAYWDLCEGVGKDREQTGFSSPDNFPPEIVEAIKRLEFKGLALDRFPTGLLLPHLYDDYRAKCKPLDDDYDAKRKPLFDDYRAKCKPLFDDYDAKRKLLDDDYDAKRKLLDDDYDAKRKLLDDDYRAKRKPLDDDYWDLFAAPENRAEAWR